MAKAIKTTNEEQKPSFVVIKTFRDSPKYVLDGETPKVYSIDEDVSYFDSERLDALIKRKIVKMTDTKQGSMVEQPTDCPPNEE